MLYLFLLFIKHPRKFILKSCFLFNIYAYAQLAFMQKHNYRCEIALEIFYIFANPC